MPSIHHSLFLSPLLSNSIASKQMSKPPNHHHHHPPRHHRPPPRHHPPPPRQHRPPPPPRSHTQQQQPQPQPQQQRQQHQQQLPVWVPPYMPGKPPKPKRTTLASCIVATIFLLFLLIILFIVYFSLFKPKDPQVSVTAIQLPTFSLSSNTTTTAVSFTFSLYAAVRNPNRGQFSHFDSSLQLLYAGNQVGFMFIPAGEIAAGRTKYMAATFSVQAFPISNSPATNFPAMVGQAGVNRVSPTMEVEARMEMVGRVRVLWFFNHNVKDVADCRVAVAINDGSVLGFHC